MKANELRLLNYLQYDKQVFQVKEIKILKNSFSVNCRPTSYFEGIQLSEEWFLKFGFKKAYFGYEKGLFEVANQSIDNYILSVACNEYTIGEPFIYVHQLQNLYFALTGEELIIKE